MYRYFRNSALLARRARAKLHKEQPLQVHLKQHDSRRKRKLMRSFNVRIDRFHEEEEIKATEGNSHEETEEDKANT